MDVIIVCHTEFGFVSKKDKEIIYDKNAKIGVKNGVENLIKLADKYKAKLTFAVCPETVGFFPKNIQHEIGLHIHPGWQKFKHKEFEWFVGDKYLREKCLQSSNSTILPDFSFSEQLAMIKWGKKFLEENFSREPKIFVAGRWSVNNDTVKALAENNFTHDCSAPGHAKSDHYNWVKLSRICLPYRPSSEDYQNNGDLPILIVPISQTLFGGTVSPEGIATYGFSWLKACFAEYYRGGVPLFHICLHSPSMTDQYYAMAMEKFLAFISGHKNINFKFASEIKEYTPQKFKTCINPYIFALNVQVIKKAIKKMKNII